MSLYSLYSSLGMLGFNEGTVDLLAVVRNNPSEPLYAFEPSDLTSSMVLAASEFRLEIQQAPQTTPKAAGEAVNPSNFLLPPLTIKCTGQAPLWSPVSGWVDPAFADLMHHAKLAYAGTPTVPMAKSLTSSSHYTYIEVDNVADFVRLSTPFNVVLRNGTLSDTVTVSSVSKSARRLNLSSASIFPIDADTLVYAPRAAGGGIMSERAFTLVSLREGVLSGCLVQSIEVTLKPGQPITYSFEVSACRLDRFNQSEVRDMRDSLQSSFSSQPPARLVGHGGVTVSSMASPQWSFGLAEPGDDPAFRGFQGLDLEPTSISEITLRVENAIKPVHTLHALGAEPMLALYTPVSRERLNSFPFALAVESRQVTGTISYKAPIEPWALAERLAGPSGAGQNGVRYALDTFAMEFPNVVWAPSQGDGRVKEPQERKVQWTMITDAYQAFPEIQLLAT